MDIIEEDDRITHFIALDDDLELEEGLDVFKFDPDFVTHEEQYSEVKAEILGDSSDEESGSGDEADASDGEDEEEDEESQRARAIQQMKSSMDIQDKTETNLVNLRRTIYLTIMSSLDFEEACHKLLKMSLKPGQERHLCAMIIECCSQERTYEKYYGLIGERFCKINRIWADCFCEEVVEKVSPCF